MKILLVQLRRIGDILLTTPVVSYLKQVFPEARVHFLAEPVGKAVLETNPFIDRLLLYDRLHQGAMIRQVRAERYDAVIDFMNNPRSGILTLFSGARWRVGWRHPIRRIFYNVAISVPEAPEYVPLRKLRLVRSWLQDIGVAASEPVIVRPTIHLDAHDESVADVWMSTEKLAPRGFVIFAPASRYAARRWIEEGYRHVAKEIVQKHGRKVYLSWGPGEEEMMASIRRGMEDKMGLLPLTTMREMAAIFKRAALTLTTDSGSLHTAVSMGTPTVSLHGPTRPVDWSPALAGVGKYDIPLNMENLTAERVLQACEKILREE